MGDIVEIGFVMWIIGIAAFAPLGYFLYLFTIGNGQSFGKSDPSDHHVEETGYYKFIDIVMRTLLGGKADKTATVQSTPAPSAAVSSSARKPRTISATAAARSASAAESSTKKSKKAAGKKEAKNKKQKSAKKSAKKAK